MAKRKPGRPPLPPDQRRVTLTVRVEPKTKREVDRLAIKLGISRGDVIDSVMNARGA